MAAFSRVPLPPFPARLPERVVVVRAARQHTHGGRGSAMTRVFVCAGEVAEARRARARETEAPARSLPFAAERARIAEVRSRRLTAGVINRCASL